MNKFLLNLKNRTINSKEKKTLLVNFTSLICHEEVEQMPAPVIVVAVVAVVVIIGGTIIKNLKK